jgi:hypothetical protein
MEPKHSLGQIIKSQPIPIGAQSESVFIDDLSEGVYFWQVQTEGSVIGTGKVMVVR